MRAASLAILAICSFGCARSFEVAPSEGLDSRAAFLGAIEPDCWDWTAGWTAYR